MVRRRHVGGTKYAIRVNELAMYEAMFQSEFFPRLLHFRPLCPFHEGKLDSNLAGMLVEDGIWVVRNIMKESSHVENLHGWLLPPATTKVLLSCCSWDVL